MQQSEPRPKVFMRHKPSGGNVGLSLDYRARLSIAVDLVKNRFGLGAMKFPVRNLYIITGLAYKKARAFSDQTYPA